MQRITIGLQDLLTHSFVLSINKKQHDFFNDVFEDAGFSPLPKLFEGFKIKRIYSLTREGMKELKGALTGPVNCTYSHVAMVKLAQYLDWPYVCIFEDDAYPRINAYNKLQEYLTDIPDDIGLLVLGDTMIKYAEFYPNDKRYSKINDIYGSHAYILFKRGYDAYLTNAYTNNAVADALLKTMPDCYAVSEKLFIQAAMPDTAADSMHQRPKGRPFHNQLTAQQISEQFPSVQKYTESLKMCGVGRFGNILFQLAQHLSNPENAGIRRVKIRPYHKCHIPYYSRIIPKLSSYIFQNKIKIELLPPDSTNGVFTGHKQGENTFNVIQMRAIIGLNAEIGDRLKKRYSDIDFNNSVGIHVRRGDYLQLNEYYHIPANSYYINAYEKFFNGKRTIVCSDDINWCKENIKINNCIYIHEDELTDFYILAMCKHHICSNSTFAWWATWINEQPDSTNIFPEFWFNPTHNKNARDAAIEKNTVPERWIKFNG